MRFALPLLAALALFTLVACGGDDDTETAEPVPLSQRVVLEQDAPGSKPDPVETRQATVDLDEFIETLNNIAIDPDTDEITDVFTEAGFKGAIIDTRFYGETHTPSAPHVNSSVIELGSEQGAQDALAWIVADAMKPCPHTCAVEISELDVEDIPGARGVRRTASAEDIAALGNEDDIPFESYQVTFTDEFFVYNVDLHGPPGTVSESQAIEIATALHHRVSGLSS